MARIAAIPIFLYFTYYESRFYSFIACLIYAATSATDFLDGWLARRRNQITVIGKFLDPLADKLIVMAALVVLVHLGRVAPWIVVVVLSREFIISGLRTIAMSEGIVIAAGPEGRYKTALQLVAVVFLLVHYDYSINFLIAEPIVNFNRVGMTLLYMSLIFSFISAWNYFRAFIDAVYKREA